MRVNWSCFILHYFGSTSDSEQLRTFPSQLIVVAHLFRYWHCFIIFSSYLPLVSKPRSVLGVLLQHVYSECLPVIVITPFLKTIKLPILFSWQKLRGEEIVLNKILLLYAHSYPESPIGESIWLFFINMHRNARERFATNCSNVIWKGKSYEPNSNSLAYSVSIRY